MSARIFIHPRCFSGPALGALQASLEACHYDMNEIKISPPSAKGFCELARLRETRPGGVMLLERMDGTQFLYESETKPDGGKVA